jgi:DNA-binding PucR family transcriptional regulator
LVAALVPADAPARRLARRLAGTAAVGLSPVERDPGALGRALAAAELALVLGERTGVSHADLLAGSWRVLLRLAVNDRTELEALVDSALGPAVEHDRTSPAGLIETLRAYLDHGANMNATAAAIYAHRHTIAYRLERVRALTGHDPQTPRGQQELALGLTALALREALVG